jgi:hypothetical protein
MPPSIHDNLLVSYEVRCEERIITLRTEYREENKPTEFTNVVFEGVQGYHFENDVFGNIIFDVATVPVEQFLTQYGAEISESYRMGGAPGTWAANLGSAPDHLREQGIKGFILSSSSGLSGWVLAREISILQAEQGVPANSPQSQPRSGGIGKPGTAVPGKKGNETRVPPGTAP